jgi:hypothetical protein
MMSGGVPSPADRLIVAAANGAQYLAADETRQVTEHVAAAGFDPAANVPVGGLTGQVWEGTTLRGGDRITSAARHYLRHVAIRQEWPVGTTLAQYIASIQEVVRDPRSGLMTSRYQEQWQLAVVRRSEGLRGPGGFGWVLVEYRIGIGYWVTAFQLRDGLRALFDPHREHRQWLRRPQ